MNLSTEAKVGLISAIGLFILGWMIIWVGHIDFNSGGYPVQALFQQVDGLVEGNPVRYAGVEVGKVTEVRVTPQGIVVKMKFRSGSVIPEGSKFTVSSMGLLGEKFIEIIPNVHATRALGDGEQVVGIDPRRLDDLFTTADQLIGDMQRLVNNLNEVVGSEQSKIALKQTILNLQAITGNLEAFSASIQRMAVYSEQDVIKMAHNLHGVSERLLSASRQADAFMHQFAADGQTGQELKESVASIHRTAQKVEKMATTLETEITDPQTIQSLKSTLQNAREASEKANKMLTKMHNIRTEGGAEVLGASGGDYQANMDLRVYNGTDGFLQVGVHDIGEENKANVQIGKHRGNFAGRMGLFEGKAGIGLDHQLGDHAKVSVEMYDPNDTRIKLRGEYYLGSGAVVIQKSDIKDDQQLTYVGYRQKF